LRGLQKRCWGSLCPPVVRSNHISDYRCYFISYSDGRVFYLPCVPVAGNYTLQKALEEGLRDM
ncbi:MAG: hypothetical protein QW561_03015, partial [Candidatus Aenigmatarchaeota archaeon]